MNALPGNATTPLSVVRSHAWGDAAAGPALQRECGFNHHGWLIALGDDKHAGGAGAMGLLGQLHQPAGLLLGAAAEAGELVPCRQQLRRAVAAHGWG